MKNRTRKNLKRYSKKRNMSKKRYSKKRNNLKGGNTRKSEFLRKIYSENKDARELKKRSFKNFST